MRVLCRSFIQDRDPRIISDLQAIYADLRPLHRVYLNPAPCGNFEGISLGNAKNCLSGEPPRTSPCSRSQTFRDFVILFAIPVNSAGVFTGVKWPLCRQAEMTTSPADSLGLGQGCLSKGELSVSPLRGAHLVNCAPQWRRSLLQDWDKFFMMAGAAAATLVGLLFVAITLGADLSTPRGVYGTRTFLTPTLLHFGAVLFQCLAVLAGR